MRSLRSSDERSLLAGAVSLRAIEFSANGLPEIPARGFRKITEAGCQEASMTMDLAVFLQRRHNLHWELRNPLPFRPYAFLQNFTAAETTESGERLRDIPANR